MKPSRRRTDAVVGYVNFPMDRIPSTNEGGCFVRLVVLDVADLTDKWMPCCGGYQYFHYDECLLGDDLYNPTPPPKGARLQVLVKYHERLMALEWARTRSLILVPEDRSGHDLEGDRKARDEKYYPDLYNEGKPGQWQSVQVLAAMTIGATGWSSGEWRCTYEDLTPEGKALYDNLQNLYTGREVRLLTYLDT